ncbi:MAG: hypothetical protein D6806_11730 [Deltaproteobacteria bacterium]|nr:MAG: hypothetical protein D6806_11730 [Deltaproteobacteria bacterium]
MSVPQSCTQAQMRSHGIGNQDPELGATEQTGAPRFSRAAADLMDFSKKLSADTAILEPTDM